ncbi:FAD-dependent oxidoreductase [uncultured Cetobacterium sp.]|uniref:FAD-dependent oxidoreductase n=1 Tax=uncultured Cetobacterium sp. TaxID=527638 RepID=UPI00262F2537|nr:FAD-dependent oxidoreductase [uncultured Cetobacterium sp.]
MKSVKLTDDIYWVGALNPELKVFDIIMETEFGTTYNSYIVKGSEKIAVFETVKEYKFEEYLKKVEDAIGDVKKIDYIILDHTEPDHTGSVGKLLDLVPNAKVVGSRNTIEFLENILNKKFAYIVVEHGDTLSLGNKTLKFLSVPFLHWPDSIYTYIEEDKTLITCDSFGAHYSFNEIVISKLPESERRNYMVALRYYYMCIFGPFKKYIIEALDKIKDLEINLILPGHGPVLDSEIKGMLETYRVWSTETKEESHKKIIMPYVTAYGYTEELAEEIEKGIKDYNSSIEVKPYKIDVGNFGKLEGEILREFSSADGILFGSSTINGDTLPLIWNLLTSLNPIVDSGKYVSAFGSYGWSGEAVPNIIDRLDQLRMNVIDGIRVKFRPSRDELNEGYNFGKTFAEYMYQEKKPEREAIEVEEDLNPDKKLMLWTCTVCGESYIQIDAPDVCPACGVGKEFFVPSEVEEPITKVNKVEKIVIIGSGIGAVSVAQSIRERNDGAIVEMYSKEREYPYYRTMLSDMIGEDLSREKFLIKPEDWYKKNKITLRLGEGVSSISFKDKIVKLLSGEKVTYDKLVLANGARPMVPNMGNLNLAGIFTIREKVDLDMLKKYAVGKERAVVVGGGILGLESACGLKELGLEVSIVEMMQRVLPRQLDREGSELFEKCIENSGVTLYKNAKVEKFEGDNKVTTVCLENGLKLDTDLVIISSGIVPNKDLVENTGIMVNRGIVVNEKMETSMEDVYACGDVAEYNGTVMGLWQVAIEQGKVVGANICGDEKTYTEQIQPVTFEGMDTMIFSAGGVLETEDSLSEKNEKYLKYKKVYFKNDEILSGILIGDIQKGTVILNGIKDRENKVRILNKLYK